MPFLATYRGVWSSRFSFRRLQPFRIPQLQKINSKIIKQKLCTVESCNCSSHGNKFSRPVFKKIFPCFIAITCWAKRSLFFPCQTRPELFFGGRQSLGGVPLEPETFFFCNAPVSIRVQVPFDQSLSASARPAIYFAHIPVLQFFALSLFILHRQYCVFFFFLLASTAVAVKHSSLQLIRTHDLHQHARLGLILLGYRQQLLPLPYHYQKLEILPIYFEPTSQSNHV